MAKKNKKAVQKRKVKWAQMIYLALGILVALSMVIGSLFVFTGAPAAQPAAVPTVVIQTPTP